MNDVRLVPPLAVGSVPVTPVVRGSPVALVRVALVGVPNTGVTKVGEVAKTAEPVPVSSVKAERRLAELGVARKVATPVPSPETPVLMGRPVQLVNTPLEGVPNAGVVSVGEVSVNPAIVVVVLPRYVAVEPSVIAVAKLLSRLDNGIALVAVANVYGTAMLEPHS